MDGPELSTDDRRHLRTLAGYIAKKAPPSPAVALLSVLVMAIVLGLLGGVELWAGWNYGVRAMFPAMPSAPFWGSACVALFVRFIGASFQPAK